MPESRWWSYVARVLNGMTALEAGRRAGFDGSAFTRWKKGASPDAAFVVKFARAFGTNVLEALAAAEIITDDEARLHEVRIGERDALRGASAGALGEEVASRLRRLEQREASLADGVRSENSGLVILEDEDVDYLGLDLGDPDRGQQRAPHPEPRAGRRG